MTKTEMLCLSFQAFAMVKASAPESDEAACWKRSEAWVLVFAQDAEGLTESEARALLDAAQAAWVEAGKVSGGIGVDASVN